MKTKKLLSIMSLIDQGRMYRPIPDLGEGQLFTGPYKLTSQLWIGIDVLVPSDTCLVVVTHNERQKFLEGPRSLRLPAGEYDAFTVSTKLHAHSMTPLELSTSDSWNVTLSMDFTWKVSKPEAVTQVDAPFETLLMRCRSVAADVVSGYEHDQLVGTPKYPVDKRKELATVFLQKLGNNQPELGIKLVTVTIRELVGDERVIQPRREAALNLVQAEANLWATETAGKVAKIRAEYELTRTQTEQKTKMVQNLPSQVHELQMQERQRHHERALTALNTMKELAVSIIRNTPQEMVGYELQGYPIHEADTQLKILEMLLKEFRQLALAAPPEIFTEVEKAYHSLMNEVTTEQNGTSKTDRNIKPTRKPDKNSPRFIYQ